MFHVKLFKITTAKLKEAMGRWEMLTVVIVDVYDHCCVDDDDVDAVGAYEKC